MFVCICTRYLKCLLLDGIEGFLGKITAVKITALSSIPCSLL